MTVNRYLFQSPSASQVQVGRLDPSVKKDDTSTSANTSQQMNTSVKQAQPVHPTKIDSESTVQDVQPTTTTTPLLDVYA